MADDNAIMAGGDTQLSILSNALSGVSLSPGKTRASSDASFPSNINHLDSLHSFIKSMESSSPEKAMNEGKVICERSPEVLNSHFGELTDALGVDKDTVTLQEKEKPLVRRREGAGRKRARFSMKPVKRKSVDCKHQYSSAIPEQDDMHMPSPELAGNVGELPEGINSPIKPDKEEIDVEESIAETEKKVNEILDELLSRDKRTLDGDGAESLLQELFQFKPIDIGKSSGPDIQDVGRTNFRILTEKIPRTRKSVSNIGNVAKYPTGETPKELIQGTERPSDSVASLTPPRSPRTSISEEHISQSNTLRDPPNDVDLSVPKNSYSGVIVEEELHQVSVLNDSSMPEDPSIYVEVDNCILQVSDIDRQKARHAGTSDSALGENIDAQAMHADTSSPHESQHDLLEQQTDVNLNGKTTEGNLCDSNADDIDRNKLAVNVGDEVEVSVVEPLPNDEAITKSASSPEKHQFNQVEESINLAAGTSFESGARRGKRIKTKPLEYWKGERLLYGRVNVDKVVEVAAEGNHMNMSSTIGEMNTAQNSEKQKSTSQKQHCTQGTQRESKAYTLSPSLAAAGTTFESGVRRSKRIKTRPLEYWKGERLLYGRVDDGLKLVGLKYISLAKGGGKLEVKSYVSDKHTEILELAAAH